MPTATAADPQTIVNDAIHQVTALATLPEVTTRIMKAIEDKRTSAGQLHQIISHDPALATRILKVVNSAFYGLPGQVASMERAIVLLGLNTVKSIAVAASLGQMFRGVRLCDGLSAKDLWTHCIAVAVASRDLARAMSASWADEAFLAGMLHDIGLLVELQLWPERLQEICAKAHAGGDFCRIERDTIEIDHAMLGAALAQHWKFPASCRQAAGLHHNPQGTDESCRALVTVVWAADVLCCQAAQGFCLTAQQQKLDPIILSAAGITDAMIQQVQATLSANIAAAKTVFA